MSWMESLYEHSPVFVESGARITVQRCRRPFLPRYVHRRHERVLRTCATSPLSMRSRRRMARGQSFPAARRGCDRCSRASGRPLRPPQVAVHPVSHPGQRGGHPARPPHHGSRGRCAFRRQVPRASSMRLLSSSRADGLVPEYQGLPEIHHRSGPRHPVQRRRRRSKRRSRRGTSQLVLTEPVMTNAGIINPDPAFHDALRRTDPRERDVARFGRDSLARRGVRGHGRRTRRSSRTCSRSASRSRPVFRWVPTG